MRVFVLVAALCLLAAMRCALAVTPENPLLAGDSVYVSQQGVYRFRLDDPKPVWSSLVGEETFEPVVFEDLLLVGSTRGLYALHADSGQISWHIEKRRTIFTPSVSAQAFAGSVHGELYAIDPKRGRIFWRRQFPGWIYSPAINEASASLWTGGQAHRAYGLSSADGSLRHEIETTQESVFSPLDLGNGRIAFNLFDGKTLVLQAATGRVEGLLDGNAQPTGLHRDGSIILRSHRDGTLSAFERNGLQPLWNEALVAQDLTMHASKPGHLLLSDGDRAMILIDLEQNNSICRYQHPGPWFLPVQIDNKKIGFFRRNLQPPGLSLVKTVARCK